MTRMYCAAAILLTFAATAPAIEKPPNVLLIIGDDMAWTDYGYMGHAVVQTPNLDRLANESVVFVRGYTPTSLCRPSLATMLTGLYPHQHQIVGNDPPKGVDRGELLRFIRQTPTIPKILGECGYASFQSGKFWEGKYSDAGFTDGMTVKGRHGDDGLVIGRKTLEPIFDFVDRQQGKPFFVWYAPMLPHLPHDPPEEFLAKYRSAERDLRQAKYWANCERFDRTCGELLDGLRKRKLLDDMLVIYVVDNGWIQSIGPVQKGEQFLTRSKNTPYEAGVRMPILIRWPKRLPAGRRSELASTIDILPTIAAVCGAKVPDDLPGGNLIDLVEGKAKAWRMANYGETYTHDIAQIGNPKASLQYRWILRGDWKLIVAADGKKVAELFNVAVDPFENKNLISENATLAAELSARLDAWWQP